MDRLIICKTDHGRYSVRPIDWEGIWDKYGIIQENGLNHTAIFSEKEDAEFFVKAKEAEEQGKMLILPCKPGDTVYIIQKRYTKCQYGQEFDESVCCGCEAEECDSKKEFVIIPHKVTNLIYCVEIIPKIGKTVFLTEPEVNKALEDMKNE